MRWNHPRHGLLGPEEFVPIAEQTGLIVPLTRWVLAAAMRQCRAWQEQGYELSVAVNLSARSFLDTALAVDIPQLLKLHGIEPTLLELEVTESTIMLDPARATATLERLSEIGLTLSIDDFGTGYSSLANLKRLPVDMIKIDKSFVLEMATEHSDAAIVPLDHRARPQPRPAGHRRGRRGSPDLGGARAARLRLRPGLLPLAAAAGRQAGAEARHGARRGGPRRAPAAAPRRRHLAATLR